MKHPISIELLEKYINGQCSEEEIALVKEWYLSFDNEHDFVAGLSAVEEKKLEAQIYSRILSNIGESEAEEETATPVITEAEEIALPPRRRFRAWLAVSGIAASLFIFAGLWYVSKQNLNNNAAADARAQELVVINNNSRQIYKAVLPDNSMAWLSPGSQLKFPKTFDSRFRAVSMTGECFFEVTKNPKRPFVITSRSIVTKVWGTSFRVRDLDKSTSADVSVVTGKVSVSIKKAENDMAGLVLKKGEVMLYPHQKVTYLADKRVLKPGTEGDEQALQQWTRLNLTFDNKPLSEIIPVLNARFHVHIKTANERLNHYILNADMAGFNLPDVLEAFKKSLNVNYEIKDNTIELE